MRLEPVYKRQYYFSIVFLLCQGFLRKKFSFYVKKGGEIRPFPILPNLVAVNADLVRCAGNEQISRIYLLVLLLSLIEYLTKFSESNAVCYDPCNILL